MSRRCLLWVYVTWLARFSVAFPPRAPSLALPSTLPVASRLKLVDSPLDFLSYSPFFSLLPPSSQLVTCFTFYFQLCFCIFCDNHPLLITVTLLTSSSFLLYLQLIPYLLLFFSFSQFLVWLWTTCFNRKFISYSRHTYISLILLLDL